MERVTVVLERFFSFIAALIPGAAVLLLLWLHYPEPVMRFWVADYLTYTTKVVLAIGCGFLAGWTAMIMLSTILKMIGGAVGAVLGLRKRKEPEAKPWQNRIWRSMLTAYLGKAAPEDVPPVFDAVLQARLKNAEQLPEPARTQHIVETLNAKAKADLNDFEWKAWWSQLHTKMFLYPSDPQAVIMDQLVLCFETASILLLFGMRNTVALRHWWLEVFCSWWIVYLVLQSIGGVVNILNPWSSFTAQMEYLQGRLTSEQQAAAKAQLPQG